MLTVQQYSILYNSIDIVTLKKVKRAVYPSWIVPR